MITVIREKPEPRRRVTCSNCGSELEYGNADLCKEEGPLPAGYAYIHSFYFHCPVCRCKEYVDWITQDTDVENNVEWKDSKIRDILLSYTKWLDKRGFFREDLQCDFEHQLETFLEMNDIKVDKGE